jgi:hypothetical protein
MGHFGELNLSPSGYDGVGYAVCPVFRPANEQAMVYKPLVSV